MTNQTNIKAFLVKAKQRTYADSSGQTASSRLASYDHIYQDGDFTYLDSYFGTHSFSGQEILWQNGVPIWSMNYYGDVLRDTFKSSFLKTALMYPTLALPYRGPEHFQEGDYRYQLTVTGNFNKFHGVEKIYYQDELTYELFLHGGRILDKHFD